MKHISTLFRILCLTSVGGLLVYSSQTMTTIIVQIVGGMFLMSGLIPLVSYFFPRFSQGTAWRPLFPVMGIGSVFFGALLLLKPLLFVTALMYLLGFILVMVSINQFLSFFASRKTAPLRWWLFLMPFCLFAIGMYVLLSPLESASLPFTLLGVGCIVYGLSELFRLLRVLYYERQKDNEYVDYEEIKETNDTDKV